jgi:hypothetical protein
MTYLARYNFTAGSSNQLARREYKAFTKDQDMVTIKPNQYTTSFKPLPHAFLLDNVFIPFYTPGAIIIPPPNVCFRFYAYVSYV